MNTNSHPPSLAHRLPTSDGFSRAGRLVTTSLGALVFLISGCSPTDDKATTTTTTAAAVSAVVSADTTTTVTSSESPAADATSEHLGGARFIVTLPVS